MASEISCTNETHERSLAPQSKVDFSLVLSRTIQSIKDDPAQLRNAIYELARIKLQRECLLTVPHLTVLETRRLMLALETAIERVEAVSSQQDEVPTLESLAQLIERADASSPSTAARRLIVEPATVDVPTSTCGSSDNPTLFAKSPRDPARARGSSPITPFFQACALVTVLLALYVVFGQRFTAFHSPSAMLDSSTSAPEAEVASQAKIPSRLHADSQQQDLKLQGGVPLPSVYGVYAVSDARLSELEPLPGRVPDSRIVIGAAIDKPSRTILPDGRIAFVIFRRDLAGSAPDRVSVRVIAKIRKSITFDAAGKPNAAANDTWAIRNIAYDFRVAPLNDNSEMVLIRSEHPEFAFAPGRYALAFKGQAYDFSVAGPIKETAQCLDRVEAVNGVFYSECRSP